MARYLIQPRNCMFVKISEFLWFAKNMSKILVKI